MVLSYAHADVPLVRLAKVRGIAQGAFFRAIYLIFTKEMTNGMLPSEGPPTPAIEAVLALTALMSGLVCTMLEDGPLLCESVVATTVQLFHGASAHLARRGGQFSA